MINQETRQAEKTLLVTYLGIDQKRVTVLRQAPGRNGQIRPVTLMIPFEGTEIAKKFLKSVNRKEIEPDMMIRLHLRQSKQDDHRCAVIVDFSVVSSETDN